METKKEYSLRSMGATTKKNLTYLSTNVEHVEVRPNRPLRKRNELARSVLIGTRGSIAVTDEHMNVVQLDAPYVIDRWVADDRGMTLMDVTSVSEGELLLVDFRVKDSVFALLPRATRLSLQTLDRVREAPDNRPQENQPMDVRRVPASATNP